MELPSTSHATEFPPEITKTLKVMPGGTKTTGQKTCQKNVVHVQLTNELGYEKIIGVGSEDASHDLDPSVDGSSESEFLTKGMAK